MLWEETATSALMDETLRLLESLWSMVEGWGGLWSEDDKGVESAADWAMT